MSKALNFIVLIVLILGVYLYRAPLQAIWVQSITHYFPCKIPISYSIGTFDDRFGLSREDFVKAISDAEKIWEGSISKDLFKHRENGALKINLVYDKRQETTLKLKDVGIAVDNSKASYDAMKTKYDSLLSIYKQAKTSFSIRLAEFDNRKSNYESDVASANRRGGADKATFVKLNNEKTYLNQEVQNLNNLQNSLNSQVEEINSLARSLNDLARELNIDVDTFNTIGGELGGEFEEGTYQSSASGQKIDIYQFENRSKLVRVLAHELGHALGLDHIEDSKAIMYRLNNGINEKLTQTDILELKNLCGIK